jgi:mitochondrial fission protein ELM1
MQPECSLDHDHQVPLRDNQNQVIGLVGIARDITQQRNDARALEEAKKQAEEANWQRVVPGEYVA